MGYHIRTGMVEENEPTLSLILTTVNKGESLRFDCQVPEKMNSTKYSFNRLLRATTILRLECRGTYVGLRERVKVREDWKHMAIIIEPALLSIGGLSALVPAQANEHDAIERLKQFEGQMDLIRFTPSPNFILERWQQELQMIGFNLIENPDVENTWIGGPVGDGGEVEYGVARIQAKVPTGFDMLSAFDPTGDMPQDG